MELSQHPVPSRQVPGGPSTSFHVVLNDTAHIERCHDVFVPYCTVIVNATLTDIGKIQRPCRVQDNNSQSDKLDFKTDTIYIRDNLFSREYIQSHELSSYCLIIDPISVHGSPGLLREPLAYSSPQWRHIRWRIARRFGSTRRFGQSLKGWRYSRKPSPLQKIVSVWSCFLFTKIKSLPNATPLWTFGPMLSRQPAVIFVALDVITDDAVRLLATLRHSWTWRRLAFSPQRQVANHDANVGFGSARYGTLEPRGLDPYVSSCDRTRQENVWSGENGVVHAGTPSRHFGQRRCSTIILGEAGRARWDFAGYGTRWLVNAYDRF